MLRMRMASVLIGAAGCVLAFAVADANADARGITVSATSTSLTVTGEEVAGGTGLCGRVGVDLFDSNGHYLNRFLADPITADPQGFSFTFDQLQTGSEYILGVWDDCESGPLPCGDPQPPAHGYYACDRRAAAPIASPTSPQPRPADRYGYCSAAGDTMPDGTPILAGTFLNLLLGQPSADPHYAGAVPAFYVEGVGITCSPTPAQVGLLGTSSTLRVDAGGVITPSGFYPYIETGEGR